MTVATKPCPSCRKAGKDTAGDNLVHHPDHGYSKCFSCGYFESSSNSGQLLFGKSMQIADRGLTKEACEKFNTEIVSYTGQFYVKKQPIDVFEERCVVFPTFKNGKIVRQKIRSLSDKSKMKLLGDTKCSTLFGKHAFSPTKKLPIVVTEGEFDAIAIYQATNLPAVSLPNGASSTSVLSQELSWLQQWKHVVLMFDQDEAGQLATEKAIDLLPVGTVRIAHPPGKDANECLMQGKEVELKNSIWNAEIYHPDTIVTVENILPEVLEKPQMGYSWPWPFLTEATYGLQPNHIYIVTGAAQVGKTEFLGATISHLVQHEQLKIGVYSLEQGAQSTIQRIVGRAVNKRLHLPSETWWDKEAITKEAMSYNEKVYLYKNNNAESLTLESLLINIRYMYMCYGIKVIVLDNLTAMCNNPIIDGRYVGKWMFMAHIMNKLFTISRELPISLIVVAHTDNDKVSRQIHIPTSVENLPNYLSITEDEMEEMINKPGLSWDSGRMPGIGNIDGPDVISKLADYVIGLARNSTSKNDVIKRTLRIKLLKTRLDSQQCGQEMALTYNYDTGNYDVL